MKQRFVSLAFASGALVLAAPVSANPASALATADAAARAVSPRLQMHELQALFGRADLGVLDIRADKDYAAGHIPGAVNTPYARYRGPADNAGALPTEAALTALFQAAGVDRDTHVVVVHGGADHTDFGAAARVYWTLKGAASPACPSSTVAPGAGRRPAARSTPRCRR